MLHFQGIIKLDSAQVLVISMTYATFSYFASDVLYVCKEISSPAISSAIRSKDAKSSRLSCLFKAVGSETQVLFVVCSTLVQSCQW